MEHTRDFRITIPLTLELDKRTALFQPRCGYVVDLEIEGTLQSTKWSNCLFVPCPAIQRSVIIQLAGREKKKFAKMVQISLVGIDSDPHKENRNPSVNSRSGIVILEIPNRMEFVYLGEQCSLKLRSFSFSFPLPPLSFFSDSRSITIVVPLISTGKAIN